MNDFQLTDYIICTGNTDSNLYTVRVYRSPPQTTENRIAIIVVSLCGSLYAKVRWLKLKCAHFMYLQFLETLDTVLIPRDYPEVSSKSIDRTSQGPLTFVDMCATLNIPPVQGWSVEPDKELVKCEVGHTLKITFSSFSDLA